MQGILKTGNCSANQNHTIDSSKMVSFAPTTKPIQTAPSGRRRNSRSHVRNLFQVFFPFSNISLPHSLLNSLKLCFNL